MERLKVFAIILSSFKQNWPYRKMATSRTFKPQLFPRGKHIIVSYRIIRSRPFPIMLVNRWKVAQKNPKKLLKSCSELEKIALKFWKVATKFRQ